MLDVMYVNCIEIYLLLRYFYSVAFSLYSPGGSKPSGLRDTYIKTVLSLTIRLPYINGLNFVLKFSIDRTVNILL
jgi:hypothetical protein